MVDVKSKSLNGPDPPWASFSGCMTASFCLQTKETHQSALIQAARRQTMLYYNSKNLFLLGVTWGLSHPWFPTEGDLSPGDWQPSVHTTRGHQVLKDLSSTEQHTEDFNCVQREAWWNLPLESPSRCIFLVMVDLMKFPGSHSMLLRKVLKALRFASCVGLSQHSWNGPLCWSKVYIYK